MQQTSLAPSDEGYSLARKGVEAFVAEIVKGGQQTKVDEAVVDVVIAEIDRKLSAQVNQIPHHPQF